MGLPERFLGATGLALSGFDDATLARAEAARDDGRVLWLAEPVSGCLEGDVRGSGRRVYRTAVALVRDDAGLRADVRCTCPIATACKHGAALIGQWLSERRQLDPETAADDDPERQQRRRQQAMLWVRRLQSMPTITDTPVPGTADPVADPGFRLYYVLVPERRRCRLRVFRLRRGPGGRLLSRADGVEDDTVDRPTEYPLLRDASGPAAAHASPIDRRVAASLAREDWQPGRGIALDAPHARAVLFDLARDGLLYLHQPPRHADEAPLRLADRRPGRLTWVEIGRIQDASEDGPPIAGAQLGLAMTGRGQPLYLAEPAWADRFTNEIGPLDLPLSPAMLDWLRDAPVVPQAVAVDIATALQARRFARPDLADRIPPLPGAAVREIREAPRPVLGLFLTSAAQRRSTRTTAITGKAWLVVSLAVEYAGQRLEPLRNATVSLQLPDGAALLVTDSDRERALRDTLIERLEDLEDDEALTLSRDSTNAPTASRQGGRTGWLTVGTVSADSLTAVRIRHDLATALRAEGWAVADQADLSWRVVSLPDEHASPGSPPGADPFHVALRPVAEVEGRYPADDWFAPTMGVRVGDRDIDLTPLLTTIVAAGGFDAWATAHVQDGIHWFQIGPGTLLRLPVDRIAPFARQVATWAEALPPTRTAKAAAAGRTAKGPGGHSGHTGPRVGRLAAARIAAAQDLPLPAQLSGLADWLARHDGIAPVSPSPQFTATLRPYQCAGVGWLRFIADGEAGGILADDMGLGKTVQVLAHLDAERARGRLDRPALVVAPTSVVTNWAAEAARHAPALRTLVLTGPDRAERIARAGDYDLVLTSYALVTRDAGALAARPWHALVLDEAQWVKNNRTRAAGALRGLDARHRIALTGTPLENHLGELWSVIDLTLPGLLADESDFRRRFRLPIERARSARAEAATNPGMRSEAAPHAAIDAGGDTVADTGTDTGGDPGASAEATAVAAITLGRERLQALSDRIRPFVLRRTKSEVLDDLPERTEIIQRIELPAEQREYYESMRSAMDRRVRETLAHGDSAGGRARGQGRLVLLDALLKLRQVCCDPSLVRERPDGPGPASRSGRINNASLPSGKRDALIELLVTLAAEDRKALVFSQFTSMLDRIEIAIDADPRLANVPRTRLDGDTADRTAAIDEFQQGDARIFLLSLKAGGVGLNLTAADTVILYDPWWNPAVERQASDRAHRIGQTQPVFVYKLIAADTIEERILAMQAEKAELAEAVLSGTLTGAAASLSHDELLALLG